jgi:hypothetical protein
MFRKIIGLHAGVTAIALALAGPVLADPAVVLDAKSSPSGGTWSFSVTLSHPETGWEDYADGWRVVLSDGTILGTRELLHPHADEQPFTRSLSGVIVPPGAKKVFIEARTNVDGWGTERFEVVID